MTVVISPFFKEGKKRQEKDSILPGKSFVVAVFVSKSKY